MKDKCNKDITKDTILGMLRTFDKQCEVISKILLKVVLGGIGSIISYPLIVMMFGLNCGGNFHIFALFYFIFPYVTI